RGHDLRLWRRSRHLTRLRATASTPRRGRPPPAARQRRAADQPAHRRTIARLLRRAGCERARARPCPRQGEPLMARQAASIFSRELALAAVKDSFPKLDPRLQLKNPVMFIVELGSVITTGIFIIDLARGRTGQLWFVGVIAIWLWLTVLFANFAEAIAGGRGKAQANALRATRTTTTALRRSA